jgi:hypothetical protein
MLSIEEDQRLLGVILVHTAPRFLWNLPQLLEEGNSLKFQLYLNELCIILSHFLSFFTLFSI